MASQGTRFDTSGTDSLPSDRVCATKGAGCQGLGAEHLRREVIVSPAAPIRVGTEWHTSSVERGHDEAVEKVWTISDHWGRSQRVSS